MLNEWKGVRQRPEEGFRRWFTDDDMDLIVWYGTDRAITGFQICYDKQEDQHALTWFADGTYSHARVDDGESGRMSGLKQTPILVQDGSFDAVALADEFNRRARAIDGDLRSFIISTVSSFAPGGKS